MLRAARWSKAIGLAPRRCLALVDFFVDLLNLGVVLATGRQLRVLDHRGLVQRGLVHLREVLREIEVDLGAVRIALIDDL